MPEFPISIIDFHGLEDSIIPMSPDAPADRGPGDDDDDDNDDDDDD